MKLNDKLSFIINISLQGVVAHWSLRLLPACSRSDIPFRVLKYRRKKKTVKRFPAYDEVAPKAKDPLLIQYGRRPRSELALIGNRRVIYEGKSFRFAFSRACLYLSHVLTFKLLAYYRVLSGNHPKDNTDGWMFAFIVFLCSSCINYAAAVRSDRQMRALIKIPNIPFEIRLQPSRSFRKQILIPHLATLYRSIIHLSYIPQPSSVSNIAPRPPVSYHKDRSSGSTVRRFTCQNESTKKLVYSSPKINATMSTVTVIPIYMKTVPVPGFAYIH